MYLKPAIERGASHGNTQSMALFTDYQACHLDILAYKIVIS